MLSQPKNALGPTAVGALPLNTMDVKAIQSRNAELPIEVTLSGIMMDVRAEQ